MFVAALGVSAETGNGAESPAPGAVTIASARASLAGAWTGKLEYRDYKSDRWFGLPVHSTIEMMRDGVTLIGHNDFDDGKAGIVTITSIGLFDPTTNREQNISFRKGQQAELSTATLRLTRAEAADKWTLEEITEGRDDNRPAHIRETTTRNGASLVTLKEVDFTDDASEAWITRNRVTLTRE